MNASTNAALPKRSWDILIPSVSHRTEKLTLLLEHLNRQLQSSPALWGSEVGVRVYRDNLQHSQSFKCQALLDSSTADYVSFIEDDDWVDDHYVELIYNALKDEPDYVGFRLRYTENGVLQVPVIHRYGVVQNELSEGVHPTTLYRQVTHLNPIRRSIATTARFEGDYTMDRQWSAQIVAGDLIRKAAYVDVALYHYRHDSEDSIQTGPYQKVQSPPTHPDFDWVVWL